MANIRSILIALPTVGHFMKVETTIAIAQTVKALQTVGINVDLHNVDSAEIVTARDMFANMLLHSDRWDALLFVDSDMGFEARLVTRMIQLSSDVVGAACPRRRLDIDRLVDRVIAHGDIAKATAQASRFTVNFDWDGRQKVPGQIFDGFCKGSAVGMAITLISRRALQAMVKAKVVEPRPDLSASGGETCYSFFGIVDEAGRRLSEDYSFCYRWTKLMGRELWICIDEEVVHVGDYAYRARYADLL